MKPTQLIYLIAALITLSCGGPAKKGETPAEPAPEAVEAATPEYFEMRTYYCYPGKREALLKRFQDHTLALFEKHGMVNIGYWTPLEGEEDVLVYLMGYPSREARDQSWEAFSNDPEWKSAYEASRQDGPIVDSVANVFLSYTDYSPRLSVEDKGPRIFSLRTYYTHPGKLEALHARFRDHTLKIFEDNGISNVVYFNLDPQTPGAANTLKYLVSFPDTAARSESWKRFGEDPAWKKAYAESITDGPLVDSITAELLVPVAFSPLK